MESKYDFQMFLRHCWKQDVKATEALRMINGVEGVNNITISTAQICFKKFPKGDNNLFGKRGFGGDTL